ncbi:hypothetical protein PR048_033292 [Dryococelus australis]|uniref:PiggyBac transposable element-derived protein domain-containing protein n=1 Tax=Dryococelus australis TaxID=614101 RepID=A0ABQ9FZW7_9NEOP|nr:hypothetical protein PR048_033292 [Dryococelus australis]
MVLDIIKNCEKILLFVSTAENLIVLAKCKTIKESTFSSLDSWHANKWCDNIATGPCFPQKNRTDRIIWHINRLVNKILNLRKFLPDQVYNYNESGLYRKCLPSKVAGTSMAEKTAPGHKSSKVCVTNVFANASGEHELKVLYVGKGKKA